MKNIETLPLSSEAKKRLKEFVSQYKRLAKIYIEVVSFDESRLIVRVEQKELVNGKQLTKTELEKRTRDLFAGEIPDEWKLTVSAVDYNRIDIDNVNAEWVRAMMLKANIKAKHLSNYTGIDKSTLSTLLNNNRDLTKWQKVALYYFFKYQELSDFKVDSEV